MSKNLKLHDWDGIARAFVIIFIGYVIIWLVTMVIVLNPHLYLLAVVCGFLGWGAWACIDNQCQFLWKEFGFDKQNDRRTPEDSS